MHRRLEWFIHLRAQGLSKGDEHPTNTPHGVWYSLPLPGTRLILARQNPTSSICNDDLNCLRTERGV